MKQVLLDIKSLKVEVLSFSTKLKEPITILDDINLTLNRGEVLGLIGESGAGKSTLGLAAMGFVRRGLKISSGSIMLDGEELANSSERTLQSIRGKKVAYVAQSAAAAFNPAHRLLPQVIEVVRIHGHIRVLDAKKEAIDTFRRIGLPHPETFGNRYPHEVSGGQLQRVMAAMALAGKPDFLVFDEPTTALDVTTQIEVLSVIKELIRDYNTAALYISHDLSVVSQIADRIKVLRNGAEVEEQKTEELLSRPIKIYTKKLLNVKQKNLKSKTLGETQIILSVRNIDASYGNSKILFKVSLDVKKSSNLAIVGESGSGKSTLARCIVGLLPVDSGELTYENRKLPRELTNRSKSDRKKIQMIYQMPDVAMNPRQTILEIIGRPTEIFLGLKKNEVQRRVKDLLELVELSPELTEKYPNQLSGGQKQRVCIARALAAEPDLIICDEITSALDPIVADGILRLLMNLQKSIGVTYIFITHDMAMVKMIADEVAVMKDGEVIEIGSSKRILTPPFNEHTELLISSTPEMRVGWLEDFLSKRKEIKL